MKTTNKFLLFLLTIHASVVVAQENIKEILMDEVQKTDAKVVGWDQYLGLGLNGTMVDNSNVVGKDDGQSTTLGIKLDGELNHKSQQGLWLNSLSLLSAYSRTPLLARYVKSEDELQVTSTYKYLFSDVSKFGAFARGKAETALFPGFDNRAEQNEYIVAKLDGTSVQINDKSLRLTDSFRPTKFAESIGLFSNLQSSDLLSVDVKAGIGLRQVLARGQRVVADKRDTLAVEVNELDDYKKAGYELGSELSGKSPNSKVSYKLSANVLFPFYESPEMKNDGSTFDKRIMELNGKVSFYLVEWASLDYVAKALRDPSLLNKTQVSQSFLLSTKYVLAEHQKN